MEDERKIISVDRIGQDTILIYLSDGTMVEVTSEQLLSFGLPRYPVPTDGESFQAAIRKALDQVPKN